MASDFASFVLWLSERREFLHNLEKEATRVLQEDKNTDKYRALMCQKAEFLEALPEEAEKHLRGIDDDAALMAAQRLEIFSRNASRALEIGSVFYMSALLYPDNHKAGEPNDLDVLVADLQALAGRER